jgi:hypothetical protein
MLLSRVLLASLAALSPAIALPRTPVSAEAQDEEALKKEYRERREKLGKFDLDAHLELARWCSGVGLKREYKSQLAYIVKEDPEHAAARKELGQVSSTASGSPRASSTR